MKVDHKLLEKYWSNQCTPVEKQAVEAWMAAGIPEEEFSLKGSTKATAEKKAVLWNKISQNTNLQESNPQEKSSVGLWPKLIGIAAVSLCVFFLGRYLLKSEQQQVSKEVTMSYVQVEVPNGKKQKLTLSDGTIILLNSGTTLRYPKEFETTKREIFLDGEAFFEVSKNPHKPFIVQTKNTQTRVLGTRFNLLSRDGDPDVLSVEEGKVQFTATNSVDTLILTGNMQSTYNAGKMSLQEIDGTAFTAWTAGELLFTNQTVKQIIPILERWYDVQINCTDPSILSNQVRGKFKQASLVAVLHDLSFALAIKYTIKGKEVSLYR